MLKRFANFLAQDGILHDEYGGSVLKHVKRTKVDDDVRQALSDAQLERLISTACRGPYGDRDAAIVVLAAGSGLRATELRLAKVSDLDLGHGTFTVRPETSKFGKERVVHLHPEVVRFLDRYLRDRETSRDPDASLFPTRTGDVFNEYGLQKVFAGYASGPPSAISLPTCSATPGRRTS